MSELVFHFLGNLDLSYKDRTLPKPATIKSQSLLAYLVLHRQHPISRERLAGIYWGEWPEHKARRSLTTSLWHIRRSLPEEDYLLADAHSVQFNPQSDLWVDVEHFESLASYHGIDELHGAVQIYVGDFLDGFFDDWIITERYRLGSLFSEVLANLMVALEEEGRYKETLITAQRLLDHDPLREDGHRGLMRCYYQLGNRNQAVEQYRRCQATLQEELGIEPTDETVELYQAIQKGHFTIQRPLEAPRIQTPVIVSKSSFGRNPLDAVSPSSLIGREKEFAFLQECWSAVASGKGSCILIDGEAGIGKTRLVEECARQVHLQGAHVLWGRCYEFERLLPYQSIADALQTILEKMTSNELNDFPAWVLAQIARLTPTVLEKHPGTKSEHSFQIDQEQGRLFDGVACFLRILSSHYPLFIVLEDLHWATESTLGLVHYLCRNLNDQKILVICTMRSASLENQQLLEILQQQLVKEVDTITLHLEPLSQEAVETMLTEMSGAGDRIQPLIKHLYDETEGNPFFLMETIKTLFENGTIEFEKGTWRGDFTKIGKGHLPLPASVKETVLYRMRGLNQESRDFLSLAAVAGRTFDFEVLNEVWRRGEESTLEALDELFRYRLIEEGKAGTERDYTFTHHLIREVIYSELPLHQRAHTHAQVGLAMERLYQANAAGFAGEIAFHFEQSQQFKDEYKERALQYLLQAGDEARLLFAQIEAIDYYNRALALLKARGHFTQAARIYMKLGLTHHTAFNFRQAREAFDNGFALWERVEKRKLATTTWTAPHPLRIPWSEPHTIDIAKSYDVSSRVLIDQLFSGLVMMSPEMDILPDVAQSWEILEEGRVYIFHLRDDISWSDGVPVTAQDFEYSWKRLLDPATGFYLASYLYDIKGAQDFHQGRVRDASQVGIRAEDDYRLVVELKAPASYFLNIISLGYPMPRHIVEEYGDQWTEVEHLVTNGPFRLVTWQPEKAMCLKRNPKYHGSFTGNLQEIKLDFHKPHEWQDKLRLFEENKLDLLEITDFPPNEIGVIRELHVDEYMSASAMMTYLVGFDQNQIPFNDKRVRQAFAMAIDKEKLADQFLNGYVFPAIGGFVPPGMPGHSPNIGLLYDPNQARTLLSSAGYPHGYGFPLLNVFLVSNPTATIISHYLQDQWKEVLGITSIWEMLPTMDSFVQKGYSQKPQVVALGWNADYPDPDDFLKVAVEHSQSFIHWHNQDYRDLVERAGQIMDQRERVRLYGLADTLLINDAALIPLYYSRRHILVKPWVNKFPFSPIQEKNWKDIILDKHGES